MKIKTCSKCKQEKSLEEFVKNKTKKDGLSYYCKECQREYVKNHYKANHDYYKNKARVRETLVREWYKEYKNGLKCSICDEDHPACIEFHHKNFDEKEMEIADAVGNGWSIRRLEKEIAKCVVFCSNCHKKHHYETRTGPYLNMPS